MDALSSRRNSLIALPTWLWGNQPEGFLAEARLRHARIKPGVWRVQTDEQYHQTSPDLVVSHDIAGPYVRRPHFNRLRYGSPEPSHPTKLESQQFQDARRRLLTRKESDGDLTALFSLFQLDYATAPSDEIAALIELQYTYLKELTFGDSVTAFPECSVHFVIRAPALIHRTKLPALLLRIEQDEPLLRGDVGIIQQRAAAGDEILSASKGISDGIFLFDAYLGPLLGAITPHIWAIQIARARGLVIHSFGQAIPGIKGEPQELIRMLPRATATPTPIRPELRQTSATAAVHWWTSHLNLLFGWLSDPTTFTDRNSKYDPGLHQQYLLTVEQLFRRVGSLQASILDSTVTRTLMFSVLDAISDRLGRKDLHFLFKPSHAKNVLNRLRASIPTEAAPILLSGAERAVAALEELRHGFYLAATAAETIEIRLPDGPSATLSLDEAVVRYLKVLRNATHGFGGQKRDSADDRSINQALLVHHDGVLPPDLPLLAYLYLLDVLSNPEDLRRFVTARATS